MPLSATFQKLINKVVAQRKPLLIRGGTEAERLALAHRIHRLLPPLTQAEKSELARLYKLAGIEKINARPFRSPHHTISEAGLCGGKTIQMPGEVALAHAGVLFLDDVAEFKGKALTRLAKILGAGECASASAAVLPARPVLIAGAERGSAEVRQLVFAETVDL